MSRINDTREVIVSSDTSGEHWSACVWDPKTGSALSTYKQGSALSRGSVQILGDSYLIGADATKPRIHIWPLNSPQPVPNLRLTTPGKVTALACSPNAAYMVAGISEKLFLWQLCNGRMLGQLSQHYQPVGCLAFSSDGSLFASGAEDGLVFVWSMFRVLNEDRPTPLHGFSHHSLPVKHLQFGRLGSRARLCSVSLDRTCNIYEPGSGTLLLTLVFDVPLTVVHITPRETDLFVGATDGGIFKFNLHEPPRGLEHHVQLQSEGDRTVAFRGHKAQIVALSVSIDARYLVSGAGDSQLHVWDIASRQILRTIEHKGPITAAFFAKHYENFRVTDLKPAIKIANLQRISDDNDANQNRSIEVIARDRSPMDILDFDSFVTESVAVEDPSVANVRNMREEIEKLKKINADIYMYSVNRIMDEK